MKRYIIVIAILLVVLSPSVTQAADKPLPHTTPKVTQKRQGVEVSWYNTTPGTYTLAQKYETCTKRYCILALRVVWKKYVKIGNIRVHDKKSVKGGSYIVY